MHFKMMVTMRPPALLFQLLLISLVNQSFSWAVGSRRSIRGGRMSAIPRSMPSVQPELLSPKELTGELARANRLIDFLDASPEPFHVVQTVKDSLLSAGFVELKERDRWANAGVVKPGGKYFYTRNGSCIVAFAVGGAVGAGGNVHGFKIIGAHTDSPALKVKPKSKRGGSGITQLNVETYGGGLWHTWFDRDLSLAGRVVVQDETTGTFSQRLVHIKHPILRVPTLCIHLQSATEREAFKVNKEDHLQPLLCGKVKDVLKGSSSKVEDDEAGQQESGWASGQEPELLSLLKEELGLGEGSDTNNSVKIVDFELTLFDTQGAALGGIKREYVNGARLDNLASCFVAMEALLCHCGSDGEREVPTKVEEGDGETAALDNAKAAPLDVDTDVCVVAFFDHEEVGSASAAGAGSPLMKDAVERITHALAAQSPAASAEGSSSSSGAADAHESFRVALDKSLVFSVDMAHAIHPNYANKHEKAHAPTMNGGPVIKSNANQRYATNGITGFLVRELGRRAGVPLQEFAVRNDCPCGSTIGPVISANTGMRAVDLGMPQLSMHSCREMMGRSDLTTAHKLFTAFFSDFRAIDDALVE